MLWRLFVDNFCATKYGLCLRAENFLMLECYLINCEESNFYERLNYKGRFVFCFMKLKIKIHPNSSQEKVEKVGEDYEVWLKEKPVNNKANLGSVKILKKYFGKEVRIKSGFSSRNKVVEVVG